MDKRKKQRRINDIVRTVANATGLKQRDVKRTIYALFDYIVDGLANSERIPFDNFGAFYIRGKFYEKDGKFIRGSMYARPAFIFSHPARKYIIDSLEEMYYNDKRT